MNLKLITIETTESIKCSISNSNETQEFTNKLDFTFEVLSYKIEKPLIPII